MQLHRFKLLEPYAGILSHAVTTREGGVSPAPFDSLNLAYHVGDDPANVDANHARLGKALGYDPASLVHMRQVHGNGVFKVDETFDYTFVPECDATITDLANVPLMVMVADCIPLLLFDPLNRAIAAVHAGRSGVFKQVITATVNAMKNAYGTRAENLLASLGGSIGVCCYEVGEEVVREAESLGFGYALEKRKGRWYLDNSRIAKKELESCGVVPAHIETMEACTACLSDLLYSYRKEAQKTGRFAGGIMLRRGA
jgi:hypothetical protein